MNTSRLRTRLLEYLSTFPNSYTERERKSLLSLTGFDHLRNQIEKWESSNLEFFSGLLDILTLKGQEPLLEFLGNLANSIAAGPEQQQRLLEFCAAIRALTPDHWAKEFVLSRAVDAQAIIRSCRRATKEEIQNIVGRKFIRELYSPRLRVEVNFRHFLESEATCFLVVAKAGRGKTNLFCKMAEELEDQQPVLFLSGRKEPKDDHDFLRYIGSRIGYGENWPACFKDLGQIAETGRVPLILIDGINESAAKPSVMQSALRELLVQAAIHRVKICVSCRTDFWSFYRASFWGEYTWRESSSPTAARVVRGEDLPLFSEEDFGNIAKNYFDFFQVQGKLVEEAWERCRNPLLLRFFCEAYSGRHVGIVSQIRLYPLFKLFWNRKINSVADISGLKIYPVSEFVLAVARLMHQKHRTKVARKELAQVLNLDLAQPGSLYDRVLDEEIILEEEVDEQLGTANVIFVYDKFSEYAIALSIFHDLEWASGTVEDILRDMRQLLQEEENHQFATLRGALEFLVMRMEDLRFTEDIHFNMIQVMLDSNWKWRRIGSTLAFQLTRTETKTFWDFIELLTLHKRDFVRRICAEQLGQLSRYHSGQALPLLNQCLKDKSDSVRKTAEETLLNLEPTSAIEEAFLLIHDKPLKEHSTYLAAQVLLSPPDGLSPLLQMKARWLVTENQDQEIQKAVFHYLANIKAQPYNDLYILEEYERVFQIGKRRQRLPDNPYLSFVRQQLEPKREALAADLERLETLRRIINLVLELAVEAFSLRRYEREAILSTAIRIFARDPDLRKHFIEDVGHLFEVPLWESLTRPRRRPYLIDRFNLKSKTSDLTSEMALIDLALEIARSSPAFSNQPPSSRLPDLLHWPTISMRLFQISEDIIKEAANWTRKATSILSLTTVLGKNGLNLEPEKLKQFRNEIASRYEIEISDTDHRALTSLGRLALWVWEAEKSLQKREQILDGKVEEIKQLSSDALKRRLSIFEVLPLSEKSQSDLILELQAICRAFLPSQAKVAAEALTPLIKWHSEYDSPLLSQTFQTLYWRDRDHFWEFTEYLLDSEDQLIIDFASQILEQAEYEEARGIPVEIFDQIQAIIVDLLGVEPSAVTPEARFREDLEADSLDLVELIMAFEDRFGGEVSDEDAASITTVGEAARYISQYMV